MILVVLALAFAVAAASTPAVKVIARRFQVIDRPNERSVNRRLDIPLLGGLAVALGFFVGLAVGIVSIDLPHARGHVEAYLIGGALLLAIGAVDDRFGLHAYPKLAIQIGAAAIAIGFGFRIDHLTDPVTREVWTFPSWLVWIATTLWIVGVTNAMNLMDGLDGLCSGIGLIIAATLAYISWQAGLPEGVVVGMALVGALLGFLVFNFPPASIFLGDTGALFIGFTLSLLALEGYQRVTVLTFIVPLLALAVPIMDTLLSISRRILRRMNPMSADRLHMHHRLLATEGNDRAAVLSIYFLTACFCIIAVSFTRLEGYAAVLFLVAVAALTFRLLRNLGFFDTGDRARAAAGEGSAGDPDHAPGESR
jgi:UDP-GlcNAc:undecaprenyl-phosphate GlcNAc-1-phosphate transferase